MPDVSSAPSGDGSSVSTAPLPMEMRTDVSLRTIRRPVEDDLDAFREYFRTAMRTEKWLLDKIARYVLRQKGKEIRPLLVLLSARACGSVTETSYRAAALVELLHTATLVHDDVVDNADRRRGVFSINALWKKKVAVLFGDFLLSRGLLLSLENSDYDMLHVLSDAVRRMSEGELLQIEKARRLNIDEDTYFQIISDKTASLIGACMRCGARSAGGDESTVERMHRAGEKLGVAFQIRDDLFDFGIEDVGKPIGIDLQEKKLTLPLIYALQRAPRRRRWKVMRIVRSNDKSGKDRREVASFVEEFGGIAYAREQMEAYAQAAHELLSELPPTTAREALLDLVAFTIQRRK